MRQAIEQIQKMREQTEKEMNDESQYTVKSECFICHSICNPTKDFEYYRNFGNCCRLCNANASKKSDSSKERHESLEKVENWIKKNSH